MTEQRVSDSWDCPRCHRAPKHSNHVCANLPPPSQQEKDLADLRAALAAERAAREQAERERDKALGQVAALREALESARTAMMHPTGHQSDWKDVCENNAIRAASNVLAETAAAAAARDARLVAEAWDKALAAEGALRGLLAIISVEEAHIGFAGGVHPTRVCGITLGEQANKALQEARAALRAAARATEGT